MKYSLAANQKNVRALRLTAGFFIIMLTFLMCVNIAFADTSTNTAAKNIEDGVKQGTSSMYSVLTSIVLPVGAVCLGWNGFKAFFGGERGMEQARKNILIIVLVLAIVFLAPVIVEQVGGWFSASSKDAAVFK